MESRSCLRRIFVPSRLCPQLSREVLQDKPLYSTLENVSGVKPARAVESYDVTTIDANEAELLNTRTEAVRFLCKEFQRTKTASYLKWRSCSCGGDRCRYEVELKGENISFLTKDRLINIHFKELYSMEWQQNKNSDRCK